MHLPVRGKNGTPPLAILRPVLIPCLGVVLLLPGNQVNLNRAIHF
jgi:hypothetical protein